MDSKQFEQGRHIIIYCTSASHGKEKYTITCLASTKLVSQDEICQNGDDCSSVCLCEYACVYVCFCINLQHQQKQNS